MLRLQSLNIWRSGSLYLSENNEKLSICKNYEHKTICGFKKIMTGIKIASSNKLVSIYHVKILNMFPYLMRIQYKSCMAHL